MNLLLMLLVGMLVGFIGAGVGMFCIGAQIMTGVLEKMEKTGALKLNRLKL